MTALEVMQEALQKIASDESTPFACAIAREALTNARALLRGLPMMGEYENAIARLRAKHGARFVEPATNAKQRFYFQGARVEVTTRYASGETEVRRGRISITTGWQPCLLLMRRVSDIGSSDCLRAEDEVTAVIDARGKRHPV